MKFVWKTRQFYKRCFFSGLFFCQFLFLKITNVLCCITVSICCANVRKTNYSLCLWRGLHGELPRTLISLVPQQHFLKLLFSGPASTPCSRSVNEFKPGENLMRCWWLSRSCWLALNKTCLFGDESQVDDAAPFHNLPFTMLCRILVSRVTDLTCSNCPASWQAALSVGKTLLPIVWDQTAFSASMSFQSHFWHQYCEQTQVYSSFLLSKEKHLWKSSYRLMSLHIPIWNPQRPEKHELGQLSKHCEPLNSNAPQTRSL